MHPSRSLLALPLREPDPDTPPAFTFVGPRRACPVPGGCSKAAAVRCPGEAMLSAHQWAKTPTFAHRWAPAFAYYYCCCCCLICSGQYEKQQQQQNIPGCPTSLRVASFAAKQSPTGEAGIGTKGTKWMKGGRRGRLLSDVWLLATDVWRLDPRFCFPEKRSSGSGPGRVLGQPQWATASSRRRAPQEQTRPSPRPSSRGSQPAGLEAHVGMQFFGGGKG